MSTNPELPIVAIPLAGEMGAGIGRVLTRHGLRVLTRTEGRSADTLRRADAAGMENADHEGLAAADIILSIVPPDLALKTAGALAPHFNRKAPPVYVDCNAVSPGSVLEIAEVIEAASGVFFDGSIIGAPPSPDGDMPKLYVSGREASRIGILARFGLDIRVLDGAVGQASALKMAYGGLTKGLTGITAALILAADRAGVGDDLRAELADSQPALLARARNALPDMIPKAYRWTAEMKHVADFIGDRPEGAVWDALGAFYAEIAGDLGRGGGEAERLRRFPEDLGRAAETGSANS